MIFVKIGFFDLKNVFLILTKLVELLLFFALKFENLEQVILKSLN